MNRLVADLLERAGHLERPVRFMEVCGTHTMVAFRSGIRRLLPGQVSLISGPGCPVCVTPAGYIDAAIQIGRGNSATQNQSGSFNAATIVQVGRGNTAVQTQR